MSSGFKDLIVWQKSITLVTDLYNFTDEFPQEERYGLTQQMRRCAVSIPSNIAEGSKRSTERDFKHFLSIAYGSAAELETQLEISRQLQFGEDNFRMNIEQLLIEVSKMLHALIYNSKDS